MTKTISAALLAAAIAAPMLAAPILAGPALAAPGDNPIRRLQWIGNDGAAAAADVDQARADWFKQHGKKLAAGTLVMTVDGSFYVLQDAKLSDGRMISQMMTR